MRFKAAKMLFILFNLFRLSAAQLDKPRSGRKSFIMSEKITFCRNYDTFVALVPCNFFPRATNYLLIMSIYFGYGLKNAKSSFKNVFSKSISIAITKDTWMLLDETNTLNWFLPRCYEVSVIVIKTTPVHSGYWMKSWTLAHIAFEQSDCFYGLRPYLPKTWAFQCNVLGSLYNR